MGKVVFLLTKRALCGHPASRMIYIPSFLDADISLHYWGAGGNLNVWRHLYHIVYWNSSQFFFGYMPSIFAFEQHSETLGKYYLFTLEHIEPRMLASSRTYRSCGARVWGLN